MLPTTRATISAAAAAVVAGAGFLGPRYIAVAVLGLIVVLALGWPVLLRASRRRVASTILMVGGALAVIAVALGRTPPYLRHMVVAVALMAIAALVSEVFFPSARGRAVTSVASIAAGSVIVASGAAWVAAGRTHGAEDLVVAAAVALAVSAIASVITPNSNLNNVIAIVAGSVTGLGAGALFAEIPWYGGLGAGLVSAMAVTLLQELSRREPRPRSVLAGISSALAPVLVAGALVYLGGRMLVG